MHRAEFELLAQFRGLALVEQGALARFRAMLRIGWKAMRSANSLNMPIVSGVSSRAGLGSMAHKPKKRPSARLIGTEM